MKVLHLTKQSFEELISQNEKKVLVDFYADWCGPCRMQAPIVEEVANESDDYIVAKLNVDEVEEVAQAYKIYSIPTILIFSKGQVENKFVGVTSKDKLLSALK